MSIRNSFHESLRLPQFLTEQEVRYAVHIHPPAYVSERRAELLGVPLERLLQGVLLTDNHKFKLALLAATQVVDFEKLAQAIGSRPLLARRHEIASVFRDCEWGVMVPFGSLYDVETILDNGFDTEGEIVFEAHFYHMAMRMSGRDFVRLEQPRRLSFARPPL